VAFPTVISRTVPGTPSTTNATSYAVTLPASVANGDLLVAVVSSDGNPTLSTVSSGWSKLNQASNSTVVTGAIFYKWYTSTTVGTLTVNSTASEQYSGIVLQIRGAEVGQIISAPANGSGTNSNPGPITLPSTRDYLFVVTRSGDSTVVATVAPTNYSQLQSRAGGGTTGASTNTAEYSVNKGTQEDPGGFTSNTEQWVCWTLGFYQDAKTASPGVGSGTVTGYAPTVTSADPNPSVSPGVGSLAVTGLAPILGVAVAIAATSLNFSSEPFAPKIEAANNYGGGYGGLLLGLNQNFQPYIQTGVGAASFTGYAPSLGISYTITPSTGEAVLSGYAPTSTVNQNAQTVNPGAGSILVEGQQPALYTGLAIQVPNGSLSFSSEPFAPKIEAAVDYGGGYGGLLLVLGNNLTGVRITPDVGSVAFTGYAPGVLTFGAIEIPTGSLTLTGYAPTLASQGGARAYGPLLILGLNLDPEFAGGYFVNIPAQGLSITGAIPTVIRSGDYDLGWDELVSGSASFDGSGVKNASITQPVASPGAGSLTITGYAPAIVNSLVVDVFSGVIVILGKTPSLDTSVALIQGSISLSGYEPAVTTVHPPVEPLAGSLSLQGYAPATHKAVFGTGNLISGRGYMFKYDDYSGTGVLEALPAALTSAVNRGSTGTGSLVAGLATIAERGWTLQPTDAEEWTCQDDAVDAWTDESTITETWTNV
jgi:hypothetical protein